MDVSAHPIVAIATPQGRGALSAIRLSGFGTHDIFANVIIEKEKFLRESERKIGIYTIVEDDVSRETPVIIDEVTAIKYTAPKSFTGEDMVEIFSHGGAVIPQKTIDRLIRAGARVAGRGEFTRRAWQSGKINLLKAESIASLIDSQTETHLKSAQLAYSGKQLESLENLKRKIINILSDIESRIEFAEEDDVAEFGSTRTAENLQELKTIINDLEEELRRSDLIKTLNDGVIVALAGPPNAGKSSLFNEILGYDRSIVHDRPGTTRDAVSEKIMFDGVAVKLFDCAGIRETEDIVEQHGIERTLSAVKDAHVVIWVTSADTPFEQQEREEILEHKEKALVIINKTDLVNDCGDNDGDSNVSRGTILSDKKNFCESNNLTYVCASLKQKIGTNDVFCRMNSTLCTATGTISSPEIILNARHRGIIALIIAELRDCVTHFSREEICAHYLKKSLELLSEFLGHVASDEVLDEIFGKFCIGK